VKYSAALLRCMDANRADPVRFGKLLFVVAVGLGAASCRPPSESHPMPVIVRSDTANAGWVVVVPVCGASDQVTSFDLSHGDTVNESRSTGESGPRRLVELHVNADTLRLGTFNPDEVKVVSNRGKLSDPSDLTAFLTTAKGYAQFNTHALGESAGVQYLVTGRSPPAVTDGDTSALDLWCT
jgi:mRNA-degrading endonuclease toxin of MazEF toxin-antitoxin module